MQKNIILILLLSSSALWAAENKTPPLPLNDFLRQVMERNEGVKAAFNNSEGAGSRAGDAEVAFSPQLFANFNYTTDEQSPPISPIFGEKSTIRKYQLGLSQNTSFGLSGKLYYDVTQTSLDGANALFVPQSQYYEPKPVLELNQSLWRNGFGRESRALETAVEAGALEKKYMQSYQAKTLLAQAEQTYWRLAAAREAVRVQKESLDRAEKIRQWNLRRANLQLGDRADLLQSEAAYKARNLEYQGAIDEESAAARSFNQARGQDSATVGEELELITEKRINEYQPPAGLPLRDDVKAAEQTARMNRATAQQGIERQRPTFDIYAAVTMKGKDEEYSKASDDAFSGQYPTNTVGVRFVTPLDFGLVSRNKAGFRMEQTAADQNFRKKTLDQATEWKDLVRRFGELREKLKLSFELEAAQLEKLKYEKVRQQKGRTTTYQVLLFEQDYASSQLLRIRSQVELLNLISQMRLYGGT